jgi:SAM-dependent methyltransferase
MEKDRQYRIPPQATLYILLQRHAQIQYMRLARFLRLDYYRSVAPWEARLRRRRIHKDYIDLMQYEFHTVESRLPEKVRTVMDIGCGIPIIDVFLFEHYGRDPEMDFYLVDKSEVSQKLNFGRDAENTFYNNLRIADDVMQANGVARERVHVLESKPDMKFGVSNLDLVVSFRAWGWHFPLAVYLEEVYRSLRPGGMLITEVAKGGIREKALLYLFEKPVAVMEDELRRRYMLIKPARERPFEAWFREA